MTISAKNSFFGLQKASVLLLFFCTSFNGYSQCAMCRAVIENEVGDNKGAAINDGIVYLMAIPYVLVAVLGYIIYKSRLKKIS